MNDTDTTVNIPRLLDLGRWLTHEERERRLGRPSHWNQGVWVQTEIDGDDAPIEVAGKPGHEEQPLFANWSCGTAACAAGHISLQDGGRPAFRYMGDIGPVPFVSEWADDIHDWVDQLSSSEMFFGGQLESIDDHARRVLGLDEDQAARLFDGDNDWDAMVYHISQFTFIPEDELLVQIGGVDMPEDPDSDW